MAKKYSFWYRNSLSIAFLLLMIFTLCSQAYTGWIEHNEFLQGFNAPSVSIWAYLKSGHFLQSTFENWESEFLQMALFIILTISLRQQGSSESKKMDEAEENDMIPKPDSPWPVKKGGIVLLIYKHSLSIAFILLFLISFIIHWYGSWRDYNQQQFLEGKIQEGFWRYLGSTKLWFESFQNWQSEFLSVFAIVFLSICLRQTGSPQSKPVNASHDETGGG